MTDVAVKVSRATERGIGFGSSLDGARFPAVGTKGEQVSGDGVEHVRPQEAAAGSAAGAAARAGPASTSRGPTAAAASQARLPPNVRFPADMPVRSG